MSGAYIFILIKKLSSYSLDPENMDSCMVQRWKHRRAYELKF